MNAIGRFAIFHVLLAAVSLTMQAGVRLELEVSPESILPGTAANIRVSIVNPDDRPAVLQDRITLEVVDPSGAVFSAANQAMADLPSERRVPKEFLVGDFVTSNGQLTVPAGASLKFEYPFSYQTTFFNDRRLSFPGRYRLRLGLPTSDDAMLWSSEVSVEVREPEGIDREVWLRMQELTGGAGWAWSDWAGKGFGDVVWREYRASAYVLYAVGPEQVGRTDWDARREVALKGPHRDYILLNDAKALEQELLVAIGRGDHDDAKRAADACRTVLQDLIANSADEFIKATAKGKFESLPSVARIQEMIRSVKQGVANRPRGKVLPMLNCVSDGGANTWIAWFGYSSELEYDFWLGTKTGENKFEPKPHERGQPETFKPGRFEKVFSVTFDGGPITWFIRGEKASASKNSARCN